MGHQSFGGNRQHTNYENNRNGNHNKNYSSSNSGEKEVEFWVTEENYLDNAEKVIQKIVQNPKDMITTSQIRNILSNVSDIYNVVQRMHRTGDLAQEVRSKIRELIMHCYYSAGREKNVKTFFLRSSLFMNLKGILEISTVEGKKEMPLEVQNLGEKGRFLLVHKYLESLVAFHRFYGGKDS
jgi:CRISPR-associated protein, csm2 family